MPSHPTAPERAALVGLVTSALRRVDADVSLDELAGLAEAAGASVALRMLQERRLIQPRSLAPEKSQA
jgi:50S ribosomal subunit-associated GTPase HflX